MGWGVVYWNVNWFLFNLFGILEKESKSVWSNIETLLEFSSIQYQIDALAVKMFKLDCSSCGENFIRMADLRKHTLLQHYGGTRQQGVKRKSIFDGIEMDKRNSKEARRSFLLVFTCNFCPDKFTRFTSLSFVYCLLSCCCHGHGFNWSTCLSFADLATSRSIKLFMITRKGLRSPMSLMKVTTPMMMK